MVLRAEKQRLTATLFGSFESGGAMGLGNSGLGADGASVSSSS